MISEDVKKIARKVPLLRSSYHLLRQFWKHAYHLGQSLYYAIHRSATPPPSYYLHYVRSVNPTGRPDGRIGPDTPLMRNPDGSRDFSLYNEQNFLDFPRYENYDYLHGRVRKEDMGSAALYAFGVNSFREAQRVFPETSFEDQVAAVLRVATRHPKYIADIGCGLGSLSALLVATGAKVDAVDPSPAAKERVTDTVTRLNRKSLDELHSYFRFFSLQVTDYMDVLRSAPDFPDTFVFVESVEHIPNDEMIRFVEILRARANCRLIITSAVDFHPIFPDGTGWNHVTLIDDSYYDRLSINARKKILRTGSHLVLEF